jgi:hypothetical protein
VTVLVLVFAAGNCFVEIIDFVVVTLQVTVVGRNVEAETLWTRIRVTVPTAKFCVFVVVVVEYDFRAGGTVTVVVRMMADGIDIYVTDCVLVTAGCTEVVVIVCVWYCTCVAVESATRVVMVGVETSAYGGNAQPIS